MIKKMKILIRMLVCKYLVPTFLLRKIINQIYILILGRSVDKDALLSSIAYFRRGGSLASYVSDILSSDEYAETVYRQPGPARETVRWLYRAILNREPDGSGLEAFANALIHRTLSVQDIIEQLQSSPEYISIRRANPVSYRNLVRSVFQTFLGREGDAGAIESYARTLSSGAIQIKDFINHLYGSQEARTHYYNSNVGSETEIRGIKEFIDFAWREAGDNSATKHDLIAKLESFAGGRNVLRSGGESFTRSNFTAVEDPNNRLPHSREGSPVSLKLDQSKFISVTYLVLFGRVINGEELAIWLDHFRNGLAPERMFLDLFDSPEAVDYRNAATVSPSLDDAIFYQLAVECMTGRGALSEEIRRNVERMHAGVTRPRILKELFENYVSEALDETPRVHNSETVYVLGTDKVIAAQDWFDKLSKVRSGHKVQPMVGTPTKFNSAYPLKYRNKKTVSIIASMYNAGGFIDSFLKNITSQTIFSEMCELIIIDAHSPANEFDVIKNYLNKYDNIKYIRTSTRIGIYEAWNIGIENSSGDYITNANMDDWRRADSIEIQAGILDNLEFVDVVYQDFFYTFEYGATYEELSNVHAVSMLPHVTPHNILFQNAPHNAPMWRRTLHETVGMFDTSFKSAGDHDFWIRAVLEGKTFFKCNDPHVVYYQNPDGLSTNANTPGVVEGQRVQRKYARKIIPKIFTAADEQFIKMAGLSDVGDESEITDRISLIRNELLKL